MLPNATHKVKKYQDVKYVLKVELHFFLKNVPEKQEVYAGTQHCAEIVVGN